LLPLPIAASVHKTFRRNHGANGVEHGECALCSHDENTPTNLGDTSKMLARHTMVSQKQDHNFFHCQWRVGRQRSPFRISFLAA